MKKGFLLNSTRKSTKPGSNNVASSEKTSIRDPVDGISITSSTPHTLRKGWEEGFLNKENRKVHESCSKNDKKSVVATRTSSALLIMEQDPSPAYDLTDSSNPNEQMISPLIVLVDDESKDNNSHDQQDGLHHANHSNKSFISLTSEDHNELLLREVSTKIRRTNDRKDDKQLDVNPISNFEDIGLGNHRNNQHKDVSQSLSNLTLPATSLPTKLSLLLFTLDRLYKAKRKRILKQHENERNFEHDEIQQEKVVLNDFLEEFITVENNPTLYLQPKANLLFIFDNIFEDVASHVKSKIRYYWDPFRDQILPPCWVLGLAIFDKNSKVAFESIIDYWDKKIDLLRDEKANSKIVKLEKMKMIGSLICIKMKICSWRGFLLTRLHFHSKDDSKNPLLSSYYSCDFLLARGLPYLLRLLQIDGTMIKRTLFTDTVLETAFCIIDYACLSNVLQPKVHNGESVFTFDDLLQVKTLLVVLEKWWVKDTSNSDNGNEKDMKQNCYGAILADLRAAIKDTEKEVDRSICDGELDPKHAALFAKDSLSKHLSGIYMCTDDGIQTPRSFGGIAQSTCKDLSLSDFSDENYMLSSLNKAYVFIHNAYSLGKRENIHETTAILRSCCFWLIQNTNTKALDECRTECLEKAIQMLKSKQQRTINLLLAIIYTLLPTDTGDVNVESSLRLLIEDLNISSSNEFELSETEKIKCILVVRLIQDRHLNMIPYFIKHARLNECKIQVLLLFLDISHFSDELRCTLEKTLLEYLPKSKYLQKQATVIGITFGTMPLRILFESLFDMISKEDASSYLVSSATCTISNIISARSDTQNEELVTALIFILQSNINHHRIFDKHAGNWFRRLLTDKNCSDDAYRSILESCSAAMLNDPSNGIILNVFGSVVGKGYDCITYNCCTVRKRISLGTEALLHVVVTELLGQVEKDEINIFSRLCPLLLVRRLPREHLQLIKNRKLLEELGDIIASRLRLTTISKDVTELSPEERRLFAEIAARSFSFSSSFDDSRGFSKFCKPTIASTVSMISQYRMSQLCWSSIKIVLYIGCQLIQTSPESIGVAELRDFTTFALTLLHAQFSTDDISATEVQAGCIDFLAWCICAPYMALLSSKTDAHDLIETSMIVEVENTRNSSDHSSNQVLLEYFHNLQVDMMKLIQSEMPPNLSGSFNESTFVDHTWTPESKNDLLNAFVISSQRCPENQIFSFAHNGSMRKILSILHYRYETFSNDELLVPSAMRFIFTLLQRRKSFDVLHPVESESKRVATDLFDLALKTTMYCRKECDRYILNALRQEGLKMLMVILSIDQIRPTRKVVTATNTLKAVSLLQEISNIDSDANIRNLAQKLLSCLT